MAKLTTAQKDQLKQFQNFTQGTEEQAIHFLTKSGWKVDLAADMFWNQAGTTTPQTSKTKNSNTVSISNLENLFNAYKDEHENAILLEGTEKLCQDLQVDTQDPVVLVLAWHLKSPNMCEFTKEGWIEGWTALGADTLPKMQASLATMRNDLKDEEKFKSIYQFTFVFAKSDEQKNLDRDSAIAFWQLLLKDKFQHLDIWIQFLMEKSNDRPITKDSWNSLLTFIAEEAPVDYSNHDPMSSWPVLIDSFVSYAREKLGLPPLE